MLVEQRKKWREDFCKGGKPDNAVLEDYRKHRDSEQWRVNSDYEKLCEYVMFLERQLEIADKIAEKRLNP